MSLSRVAVVLFCLMTLCMTADARDNQLHASVIAAMRSDQTNEFSLPIQLEAGHDLPPQVRLRFLVNREPTPPQGDRTGACMIVSASEGAMQQDLLWIPIETPDYVPSSYAVGYDEQSRTLAIALSGWRLGCIVYELQIPREDESVSPLVLPSIRADIGQSRVSEVRAMRSVVLLSEYEKYVGRAQKVQRLVPGELCAQGGRFILNVTLPPPIGPPQLPVRATLSKAINETDDDWRPEQVEVPSANAQLCYQNIRHIGAAKKQWALAESKTVGDGSDVAEVDGYIKSGHPQCPEGGEYIYGAVGEPVRCTVHGSLE